MYGERMLIKWAQFSEKLVVCRFISDGSINAETLGRFVAADTEKQHYEQGLCGEASYLALLFVISSPPVQFGPLPRGASVLLLALSLS